MLRSPKFNTIAFREDQEETIDDVELTIHDNFSTAISFTEPKHQTTKMNFGLEITPMKVPSRMFFRKVKV